MKEDKNTLTLDGPLFEVEKGKGREVKSCSQVISVLLKRVLSTLYY
jgi:hypothetical protein